MKIKKCVITLAGMGTRMLPITKTITKEMLPIINEPILFKQVKEAYLSGINEIIFVCSNKNINFIKNYFQHDNNLDEFLINDIKKQETLKELKEIINNMTFHYVIEKAKGSYGAILAAKEYLNNEPFAVIFSDDLIESKTPVLKELINEYEKTNTMVIGVLNTNYNDLPNYGLVKYQKDNIVEDLEYKKNLPIGNYDILKGRFILDTNIFNVKEALHYRDNNELQLPEALLHFLPIRSVKIKGNYFDTGTKLGYIKANIYYGLKNKELNNDLLNYIKSII